MKTKLRFADPILICIIVYLILYTMLSGASLTAFPFVHSDEAWLAGLTRDMQVSGSFGVTESFFDLKPRLPHAIKLLFHALQMIYLQLFGFNIQAVRLLSLTVGLICLLLLCRIGKEMGSLWIGASLMAVVSLDISFIYASHFARPEIILSAGMMAVILLLLKMEKTGSSIRVTAALAVITGTMVGVHPGSFLIAAVCGAVMVSCRCFRSLLHYVGITGAIAAVFVGISFHFSPLFLPEYFRYGEQEFQISSDVTARLAQFLYFFKSLYARESGTYYIPDLRLQMIVLPVFFVLLFFAWLFLRNSSETDVCSWCRSSKIILSAMAGLTLGMVVIGRYNQTSIIFFLLIGYLALFQVFLLFEHPGPIIAAAATAILLMAGSYGQIREHAANPSYSSYLEQLGSLVLPGEKTIANLNAGFFFEQGMLRDYRNLPYLTNREDLEQYIEENNIRYICLTEELDYIYENRPDYNVIYGNAAIFKDLKSYCETSCTLVGSFENPLYGARIITLLKDPEYAAVTVYQISADASPADS